MADFGSNDRTLLARTHLGAVLHAGDTALGYDLASSNITDPELEQALHKGLTLPDVILVRPAGCICRPALCSRPLGALRMMKLLASSWARPRSRAPSSATTPKV